eukprot:767225-Hanusia_phi.AAC.2
MMVCQLLRFYQMVPPRPKSPEALDEFLAAERSLVHRDENFVLKSLKVKWRFYSHEIHNMGDRNKTLAP